MDGICSEKVFAYNWARKTLYFTVFGEKENFLRTVKMDGGQDEVIQLPEVYDNAYDIIAVLENERTRVVVGVAKTRRLFCIYFDLRDGSMSCEPVGDVGVLYATCFRVEETFYLSVESEKKEGIIYRYEERTEDFVQVWRSGDRYVLNVTKIADDRLGVESRRYSDKKRECIIADAKTGKRCWEISFNIASEERFCCDIGKYIIASDVLGETRFFCVRTMTDNTVELLDVGYLNGHEYEYLHCIRKRMLVFYESGATVSDIVLYDVVKGKEAGRIQDVLPFPKCIKESGGKLFIVVSDVDSQLQIYSVDLDSYGISVVYHYEERKRGLIFEKKKLNVTDQRIMDYIVYEQSGTVPIGTVCMLHGGPNTHWYPHFDRRICYMAEAGYKVYFPNYFGSSGYGKIDYTQDENKWGKTDVLDIVRLGEKLPSGKRVLYGESYGGFLAFLVWLKRPKLWDKVILYAPFFTPQSLWNASKDELSRKTVERCGQWDMEEIIRKTEVPQEAVQDTEFYIIHGTEDQVVPCQESVKIVDFLMKSFTWGRNVPQLYLLDGVEHSGGGIKGELQRDKLIASVLQE